MDLLARVVAQFLQGTKGPSQSQIDYARRLLKQVGEDEPDWSKFDSVEMSKLIDGLKQKRGKPVFFGNGQFSHWEKRARHFQASYFSVGDIVLYGKYKNKRGKVVAFGKDQWGNPTVEIEPIPKGRKSNKVFGLFKIWRADVKETVLQERALAEEKAEEKAQAIGGPAKLAEQPDLDDDDDDDDDEELILRVARRFATH
jgi:hypothetical protein